MKRNKIRTTEEAIDSKWIMGSPTYFMVRLKYKSWLKTFSACETIHENISPNMKREKAGRSKFPLDYIRVPKIYLLRTHLGAVRKNSIYL